MFWPTFSQILITFSFWKAFDIRKRTAQVLQLNFFKLFANKLSKEICTFLVFLNYTSGYIKICKFFVYMKWHDWHKPECEKQNKQISVQSSLKSHPLWVTSSSMICNLHTTRKTYTHYKESLDWRISSNNILFASCSKFLKKTV